MSLLPEKLQPAAKAVAGALVTAAGYLIGVLGAEDTIADVNTVQWLGLIVALGGGGGLVYAVRNKIPAAEIGTLVVADPVEEMARKIYEHHDFGSWDPQFSTKPKWVPGGNALMQGLARRFARAALNPPAADPLAKD